MNDLNNTLIDGLYRPFIPIDPIRSLFMQFGPDLDPYVGHDVVLVEIDI